MSACNCRSFPQILNRCEKSGLGARFHEHGRLGISGATNRLKIGGRLRLIPGHCDPTANLYE